MLWTGYTATFPGWGTEPPEKLPTEEVFRYTDQAISVDGPLMGRFQALAKELDMAIAVRWPPAGPARAHGRRAGWATAT